MLQISEAAICAALSDVQILLMYTSHVLHVIKAWLVIWIIKTLRKNPYFVLHHYFHQTSNRGMHALTM